MSPASRGLLPGLFLAVAVAFAVLAVNRHWLLPSLDETGVRYLTAAPQLATGAGPAIPIASWDDEAATSGLGDHGTLMPLLMAALSAGGTRPHVAALWVLAGAASLTVLALAWVAGGAAGTLGAVLAGVLVALAPFTLDAATAVRPALLLGGLTAVLVGAMTYQPGWHVVHGGLAALAWLAHPAGVGAVAATVVWPAATGAGRRRWGRAALLAAAPAVALLALGALWPLLAPPAGAPSLPALGRALDGLARALVPLPGGWWTRVAAAAVLVGGVFLVVAEARTSPKPPAVPHWSDPAAMDLLAGRLRRAAGLVALGSVLGAAWGGSVPGVPGAPGGWLPAVWVYLALAATASVRAARRRRGAPGWAPLAILLLWGAAAAWDSGHRLVRLRDEGRDATARVWVSSPVIRWIDNSSRPWTEIYASDPALVLVQSGRAARTLPAAESDPTAFVRRFATHPGAVVLTGPDRAARATALAELLGLTEVVRAEEGRILLPRHAPDPRP